MAWEHSLKPLPSLIRKIFAALLFLVALVPVAMVLMHEADPVGNLVFWYQFSGAAQRVGFYLALAAGAATLLYPPALPYLRLAFAKIRGRMGTDRAPLREGLVRLEHLETHDERLKVGRLARQLGNTKLAGENLARAFELDPKHVSGRYQFALLLSEVGNHADAATLMMTVVRDDEKHAFGDALFQLGLSLYRLHRDDEGIAALRRHLELFPGGRQAQLLLARTLADNGEMDAAREQLELARRPIEDGRRLDHREALARAQARVTFLRARRSKTKDGDEHA